MEISFEFFPPKTDDGLNKLVETATQITNTANPTYFSVTFGAGGSTREHTPNTVAQISAATQTVTAPHISCVTASKDELLALLSDYKAKGIKKLVVLRGDNPSGCVNDGPLRYAYQLVELIREHFNKDFLISVAAYPETHPESKNMQDELLHFKQKVAAGADQAITQYFYNADAYFHFRDRCEKLGITVPITPGIMPITNADKLLRFSNMCGAEVPLWIKKQLAAYNEDQNAIREFGFDVVSQLCETLLAGGAPGLHFYTLNQANPSLKIYKQLTNA